MHAPVVINDSQMPRLSPCPRDTFALPKKIWPDIEFYDSSSVSVDILLNNMLQLYNHLKGVTPSIFAQDLQAGDLASVATSCPWIQPPLVS